MMRLSNIGTVLVHGRNELHLKFNNDKDLKQAYVEITQRMEHQELKKLGRKWISVPISK